MSFWNIGKFLLSFNFRFSNHLFYFFSLCHFFFLCLILINYFYYFSSIDRHANSVKHQWNELILMLIIVNVSDVKLHVIFVPKLWNSSSSIIIIIKMNVLIILFLVSIIIVPQRWWEKMPFNTILCVLRKLSRAVLKDVLIRIHVILLNRISRMIC